MVTSRIPLTFPLRYVFQQISAQMGNHSDSISTSATSRFSSRSRALCVLFRQAGCRLFPFQFANSTPLGIALGNSHNLLSDVLRRKNEIDAPACYGAPGHIRVGGSLRLLCNGDAPNFPYAAQRRCPVAIVAGDDDGDKFAVPMLRQRAKKDCDYVRPAPGF